MPDLQMEQLWPNDCESQRLLSAEACTHTEVLGLRTVLAISSAPVTFLGCEPATL